jgi:RNA methyltransferase, TrmH family
VGRTPHRQAASTTSTTTATSPRRSPTRASPLEEHAQEQEHKVAGENACRALFQARPGDIRRVYVTDAVLPRFKDVLKFCAEQRLAYHVKTDDDLDQIAETVHHDGVLFVARRRADVRVAELVSWLDTLGPTRPASIVLLENVKNPHNLGAIVRVCAHFGVTWVLRAGLTPALSPAVMRTAEGGAEVCRLVDATQAADLDAALKALRARGFRLVATSSHATATLGQARLPGRAVFLFGSEGEGLTPALTSRADDVVAIPGSGALESLNVACAASVVLWEAFTSVDQRSTVPSTGHSTRHATGHATKRSTVRSTSPSSPRPPSAPRAQGRGRGTRRPPTA